MIPALIRSGQGFACVALSLVLTDNFGYDLQLCGKEDFINYGSFFHKVCFYVLALAAERILVYGVWCQSDAAMIACGVSYNGTEGK